jgi:hypothetical protein
MERNPAPWPPPVRGANGICPASLRVRLTRHLRPLRIRGSESSSAEAAIQPCPKCNFRCAAKLPWEENRTTNQVRYSRNPSSRRRSRHSLQIPKRPNQVRHREPNRERGPSPGKCPAIVPPKSATDFHQTTASLRPVEDTLFTICRECQAGLDVFLGKVRKVGEDFVLRHAAGKIFQDIIDRDPHPPNAGFPTALAWLDRDDLPVVHGRKDARANPRRKPGTRP